jgi:hypothetical protein
MSTALNFKFFVDTFSLSHTLSFLHPSSRQEGTPVVNMHIYRGGPQYSDMLIVVSKSEVRQVPLHRCGLRTKCGGCVALQDPYCAWHENRCGNFKQG